MLTKSLGSIVFATLLFCSFNTQANVEVKTIDHQKTSAICWGIIEVIQVERNSVTLEVNETSTTLILVDSNNIDVYEVTVIDSETWIIDTSGLPVGTYELQATYNGQTQTETIVLEQE
ncbi:MAG: hypothetical protein AB8G11_24815 [Saprospiraceae bacterium]